METVSPPSLTNLSDPAFELEKCHYLLGLVWRKTYLTEHTYRTLIAVICINSLSMIPTILLNALVIFVVATRRPLQTTSNILLACLAVTDLLTGLVVQPIAIAVAVKRAFGVYPFCAMEMVHTITFLAQFIPSLSHLVLISIDRYVAIKDPLRYREIVTKARIKKAVLVAWAIAVFITIQETLLAVIIKSGSRIYLVYSMLSGATVAVFGFSCIVGICYCYVYIFSETRRQKKRLQTEQLTQEEAKRIKKDSKAANTLAFVLTTLLVSCLPSIVLVLAVLTVSGDKLNSKVRVCFESWASTSVFLGSLVNPIIYCWRNKKLRRAFLEICHVRQPENRAQDIEMIDIQRHRPEIQPSTCEAFSMAAANQEPVLLSFSHLQAEEIVHIQEIRDEIL